MGEGGEKEQQLERGLSTPAALGINIIDMVGVGPFVTLPLIVVAMGGPQAILGWLLGAALSICDGLVWSELGTTYPEAGGSYSYLKHLYGERSLGRVLSFLYAWQLLLSAPLSIASGCIGFAQYLSYFFPASDHSFFSTTFLRIPIVVSGQTFLAMGACLAALLVLQRRVRTLDRVVRWLSGIVLLALVWIIVAGLTHFHFSQAFDFPQGAFHPGGAFFSSLGAGMLIAAYDYWGYYNICFLGSEVKNPQKAIPRAVLGAIGIVCLLYLLMNVSVLGVIPWRELASNAAGHARMYVIALFMGRIYGNAAAAAVVVLISLAALASVLALLMGYSRIPYAAAIDGNFPAAFGKIHSKHHIPYISLRTLGAMTLLCCLFRLQEVITTLVIIRILFQFLLQGMAVLLPSHRRSRKKLAFRMPFYPLPALLALAGFLFILFSRPAFLREIRIAIVVLLFGLLVYELRRRFSRDRNAMFAAGNASLK